VLGVAGRAPATLDILVRDQDMQNIVASDEFERSAGQPALPLAWQWNHNPAPAFWSLEARPGALRLSTNRVDQDLVQARNTLTQRTFGPVSAARTALDTSQMRNGDRAGLAAFQRRYGFVGVMMDDGVRSIAMVSAESDTPKVIERVPFEATHVHLKVECDFRDQTDKAYFYYSLDGASWTTIGQRLQMSYTLPEHFMGYRFALFNFATLEMGGSVDFDFFRLSDALTGAQ
jgi:beta-xylosidase